MRWNGKAAAAAATLFSVELAIFLFATGPLRSVVGDLLVVVLVVALLAAAGLGRPWQRLVGVGVLALVTELTQGLGWVAPEAHWLLHLTVGSTFDPLDLLAYALGLGVAAGAERVWAVAPA